MSDILLSVGLQTGSAETSQIQSDLQRIISRIDKNPPKVKVGLQVDQSAINHFKSQLTQIVNSVGLSKGAPITVNISGIGEITTQATKAKKALDGVAKAGKQAADAVNKMSAKQSADAITKINQLLIQMQANHAKWTAAQSGSSSVSYTAYGKQIDALILLKGQVDANAISAEDFAIKLSEIRAAATDAAAAIKAVGEDHTAKQVEILTKNSDAYNSALGETESLLARVKKRQEEWTAARNGKSSGAYRDLDKYRIALESLIGKLATGEMSADEFAAAFNNIKSKVQSAEGTIKAAGENTKTLGDRLKGLADKFGAWLSVSQVIMQAVRAIKQMVTAVREIDAAMTELKKVTDETNATYDKFLANAGARAKKVGASISDVVTATADFARLGYDIDKASVLADTAIIYKNIGDGIEDITTASESIISTMQAFGIEASNAMSIVDKFNEVGNNFAISSAGIGEAMQRSAAAMASANNTIDETIALITAANTIVQDPDSVGTTMKTVSMYLRAAKTEAEDAGESTEGMANSVSELRQEILDLTGQRVDIQIDEDTFKSTYQILQELSKVWDSLTDVTQANLLEMIGGKRNSNVVSALLENFSVAEEALKSSMESAGSAMAENEKHLDSINGKIEIFKAAFEELAMNFISSDFIKGIVDFGTGLINVLGAVAKLIDALGGLNTVLYVTASLLVVSKYETILTFMSKLGGSVIKVVDKIGIFNQSFAKLKSSGVGTLNALSQALNTVGISASKVQIILAAIAAVIGIAVSAYNKWKQAQEQARQEAISQAEAAAELSGEISDLTIQYIALSEAVKTDSSAKESLIQTQDALIEKLGLEQYEIDKLIEKYGSLSDAILQASKQELQTAEIDLTAGVKAREDELMDAISWVQRDNGEYNSAYIDLLGIGYYSGGSLFPTDADYAKMEKAHADSLAAFEALQKAGLLGAGSKRNGMGDFILEFGFDIDSVEGMIATHEKLRQMLFVVDDAAGSNNQVYEHLYEMYKNIDGAVANYTNSVGELNSNLAQQYVIQELIGKEVPGTRDGFDVYRQSVIDAAVASGEFIGSTEQIESAIDSVLKQDASFAHFYTDVAEDASSAATSTTDAWKSYTEQLAAILKDGDVSAVSNEITTLADALSKLHDGTLEANDVITLIEQFPELAEYVDFTADNFGNLEEGLRNLIKSSPDEFVKTLQEFKETNNLTGEAAEQIDALCDAVNNMSTEAIKDASGEFGVLAEAINAAKTAQNELEAALAEDDWDTGYEGRVKAFAGMKEVFASGEFGSKAYAAYKEYFGLMGKSTDEVQEWMNANAKFFTEGKTGVNEFMKLIDSMDDAGGKLEGIASFDSLTGEFRYDINRLDEFASALGWTEEMLQDFIYKYRMYCEEWTSRSANMNNDEFVGAKLIVESSENAFVSLEKLQDYTNTTKEGAIALIKEINAYRFASNLPPVQIIGVDQVRFTQEMVNALAETKGSAQEVMTYLAEIGQMDGVTFDAGIVFNEKSIEEILASGGNASVETVSVPVKVIGENGQELTVYVEAMDSEIASILGDGWETTILDNTADVQERVNALITLLNGLSGSTFSINIDGRVSSSGGALQSVLGGITGASTSRGPHSGIYAETKTYASGTGSAPSGPALLGDEYSPDGTPKPELVVSDDSAYIAGVNGPEIGYLNAGDIVYTADQTRKILRGSRSIRNTKIPAFNSGRNAQLPGFGVGNGYLTASLSKAINAKLVDAVDDAYKAAIQQAGGKPYLPNGTPNNSNNGKDNSDSTKETIKSFEEFYAEHQHLLAMEQETSEEYLVWLQDAYKEAYKNNEIELDDFRKYEQEVYELQKELFSDRLKDIEFQISQMERESGNSLQIINLYEGMIADISVEIEKARKRGLDDNSDYIQELIGQQNDYADKIADIREEANDNAKSAAEDLVDYRIDMLKQELEDEKDALDKRLDDLKEFYDKQKEMLQDAHDEEEYLDEQREKRKAKEDIESELARLEFDDSAWAQKRKLELQEELADANKELADFEKDHALETTLDFLDKTYEKQESKIQDQIDAIDAKLNNPEALYNKALADIQNNTLALYNEMVEYNKRHGSGNAEDTAEMWNEAKKSLDAYMSTYGEAYKGIMLVPLPVGAGYASGTSSAASGLHQLFENGDEYFFTSPSTGRRYRVFSGGEKVLNAKATDFLYNFANSGGETVTRIFSELVNALTPSNIGTRNQPIQLTTGDIIIQGNASEATVSEIRRAQRENMDYFLKRINHLSK